MASSEMMNEQIKIKRIEVHAKIFFSFLVFLFDIPDSTGELVIIESLTIFVDQNSEYVRIQIHPHQNFIFGETQRGLPENYRRKHKKRNALR